MKSQAQKADAFRALHRAGDPLVLYNIWDAGGAKVLAEAGAQAIATGSWSMAAAQGYEDGEVMPLDLALGVVQRIISTVECPVTVDFEGGHAAAPDEVARNVRHLIDRGTAGLNFEDQIVGTKELYSIEDQAARLRAIRRAADESGIPIFINARTDLFLKNKASVEHELLLGEAIARQNSYAEAGADGYFVPGLRNPRLIARLCEASALPVNVMMMDELSSVAEVAALGVSRCSYGPSPFIQAMQELASAQKKALAT